MSPSVTPKHFLGPSPVVRSPLRGAWILSRWARSAIAGWLIVAGASLVPGMSLAETLSTYGRYYLTTSLVYDAFRAGANAALVLALGGPLLRLLERYRARFSWQPWTPLPPAAAPQRPARLVAPSEGGL